MADSTSTSFLCRRGEKSIHTPRGVAFAMNYTTALLVDVVGTLALLGRDPTRPGVSVEMNQSFLAAAREGERLTIAGTVLKYGRTLGFTEVTISSADKPGRLIAVGRHTKFLDL